MHKIYENDDLMMYITKRYCHCCGSVLQKRKTERLVTKEDPEHRVYCTIGRGYKPHGDVLVIAMEYYCEKCKQGFSCEEQGQILEAQKELKRKIVSLEEVRTTKKNSTKKLLHALNKSTWFLVIPVIGSLLCTGMIFNGKLNERVQPRDFMKIMVSSVLTFIIVAFALKSIFNLFPDFLSFQTANIEEALSLGFASLSFNIPTFIYIRRFKKRYSNTGDEQT